MSTAYFIEPEEHVDFETFVNGKAIAQAGDDFHQLCHRLGIQEIAAFNSQGAGSLGEEEGLADDEEVKWFEAEDGLNWVQTLKEHLEEHPGELIDGDAVIEDLKEYIEVLTQLEAEGIRWHLEVDF